jgi:hypothetical protein
MRSAGELQERPAADVLGGTGRVGTVRGTWRSLAFFWGVDVHVLRPFSGTVLRWA